MGNNEFFQFGGEKDGKLSVKNANFFEVLKIKNIDINDITQKTWIIMESKLICHLVGNSMVNF